MDALMFAAAIGCGLNAGVFFAFSSFVMKALARLPPAQGINAMNSINVLAVTPAFMTALFGTGVVCCLLAVSSLLTYQRAGAAYLLAGAAIYLAGAILVTIVFNVPWNKALAASNHQGSDGGTRVWSDFVSIWTMWNHVRTVASLIAASLLTIGLCKSRGGALF
jgi:uncharacterized membrane protein